MNSLFISVSLWSLHLQSPPLSFTLSVCFLLSLCRSLLSVFLHSSHLSFMRSLLVFPSTESTLWPDVISFLEDASPLLPAPRKSGVWSVFLSCLLDYIYLNSLKKTKCRRIFRSPEMENVIFNILFIIDYSAVQFWFIWLSKNRAHLSFDHLATVIDSSVYSCLDCCNTSNTCHTQQNTAAHHFPFHLYLCQATAN